MYMHVMASLTKGTLQDLVLLVAHSKYSMDSNVDFPPTCANTHLYFHSH